MGAFLDGLASQAGRNIALQPLWGSNVAAADVAERTGEKTADFASIGVGSALAVGGTAGFVYLQRARATGSMPLGVKNAVAHGSSRWKVGALLVAAAGVVHAAAGVRNLFADHSGEPLPLPGPDVPLPLPGPKVPPPGSQDPGEPTDPPPTPPTFPPGDPEPVPAPPDEPGHPKKPSRPDPDPGQRPDPVTRPDIGKGQGGTSVYVSRPGDYLSHLASCFDVSWQQLYWRNRKAIGPDPDVLRPGTKLVVPPRDFKAPAFDYTPTYTPGIRGNVLDCLPVTPDR